MTRYLLLLTATLAIAGGLIAFAVTAFGQTTPLSVAIDATKVYAHNDAETNGLLDDLGTRACAARLRCARAHLRRLDTEPRMEQEHRRSELERPDFSPF